MDETAKQVNKVITRFPPSPTGNLHVGSARTALFNFLFAKKNNGKLILRFEDTDKQRSKKEYEQDIFEGLEWLGISFESVYHQSERTLVYQKYLQKLIESGAAYFSETSTVSELNQTGEEDEESSIDEAPARVIRLKNQNKVVRFNDAVRGEISVDTTELGDFIIARSIEEPLYHFAVVVDDFEMGVTHVIRGEDGVYNTPRQILIQEAIGAPTPVYCHIPFVLGSDKKKLSKRHGAVSLIDYKNAGFLPEAVINYLAMLGWNPGDNKEIFTTDEILSIFDFSGIQKSGAVFDIEKLRWMNKEHIKKLSSDNLKKMILQNLPEEAKQLPLWNEAKFAKAIPAISERITIFSDVKRLWKEGEFHYFFDKPSNVEPSLLLPKIKTKTLSKNEAITHLEKSKDLLLSAGEEDWTLEKIKTILMNYADEEGRTNVLWPLRTALSGKEKSPDPFTLCFILGREESVARIDFAISVLRG